MYIPYLTEVQANWLFVVVIGIALVSTFKILYNEYVKSLMRKDYLAKAAEQDGCSKMSIFRKAAEEADIEIKRHVVIEDFKRYDANGINGIYPQYVRNYLKDRFSMM